MDTLKKQLERIQQQLAGLSASQKMLTASLLAIMVMTFVWWGRYAADSEMEPVFNQSLSTDDMQNVKRVLTSEGIRFEPSGDRILVPTEKKDYAVAALAYAQVLPKNSTGSFDDFMGKISPFTNPQMGDKMMNEFGQNRLSSIINRMPGVADAQVLIDPQHERVVGGNVEPSGSVIVTMKDGGIGDKKLAQAIATFVSGSNAQLRRSRVSIVIGIKTYPLHDVDPNIPDGEADEALVRTEQYFQQSVKTALSMYGDVVAVVHAKVDMTRTEQKDVSVTDVKSKVKTSENEKSTTTNPKQLSGDNGVVANTSASIDDKPAAVSGGSSETERNKDELQNFPSTTEKVSSKPAGEPKAISAAISLPRNYFVQALKAGDTSAKQPNPKDVEALFASQRDQIVEAARLAIGIDDPKAVSVMLGPDLPMLMAVEGSAQARASSGGGGVGLSLGGHLREIAVGLLALISLFMVSMMVKKGTPAPVIAAAAMEEPEPVMLGGNLTIAGEVSEGGQTLDGMELDEDAIKAQQMVEQVSTMVKENPDAAATLVKRWLNRS
jgi:flagellar biosynthesis/type III secretory pathway M-ring protein FliF/YscJ